MTGERGRAEGGEREGGAWESGSGADEVDGMRRPTGEEVAPLQERDGRSATRRARGGESSGGGGEG